MSTLSLCFFSGVIPPKFLDIDHYFQILLCPLSLFYMTFRSNNNTGKTHESLNQQSQIIFAVHK